MRRLILHIGGHKTGSTYLQMLFASMRLRNSNILYPVAGRDFLNGHHSLVPALRSGKKLESLMDALVQETKAHDGDILLSSENFEYLSTENILTLLAHFPNHSPLVVYFFRSWPQLVPSMWQEEIKHGSDQDYPTYLLRHLIAPFSSIVLNPDIPVSRFSEAISPRNIRLVSYDLAMKNTGVGSAFATEIGVDPDLLTDETRLNESYSPFLTETVRNLNAIMKGRGFPPGYHVRDKYIQEALRHEGQGIQNALNAMMMNHSIDAPALQNSRSFKEVYGRFFQLHAESISGDINEVRAAVFQSTTTCKLIDPSFMRERTAADLLSAMADRVELAMRTTENSNRKGT